MKYLTASTLLLLFSTACKSSPPKAPVQPEKVTISAEQTWTFDSGKLPSGITGVVGDWQVVDKVLAQQAKSSGSTFNVALTDNVQADVDLTVRLKAIDGHIDQGGGLIWRALDAKNYYVARYNPLEDNYRLYTVINGQRRQIAGAEVYIEHNSWHTMRVVMRGTQIECYLDGKFYLKINNPLLKVGRVGVWTKADAQTQFDDLHVIPIKAASK